MRDLFGSSIKLSLVFGACAAVWSANAPRISFLDSAAVIMEYDSVHVVHSRPSSDTSKPLRSQTGRFYDETILTDLSTRIDPNQYDFLLVFSLKEVPGWIHCGWPFWRKVKNTGLDNSLYDQASKYPKWPRVRVAIHMNSVDLLARNIGPLPNYASTLTAIHEIGHYWSVYWGFHRDSATYVGDRPFGWAKNWSPGDPVAWIAAGYFHWANVFIPSRSVGLLYSSPQSAKFNAFDLYAMGLMGYQEARKHKYRIHTSGENYREFDLTIDTLINANKLMNNIWPEKKGDGWSMPGKVFHEGDGCRIPDTDSTVEDLRSLIVVVKGQDETFTDKQKGLVRKLAKELPAAWHAATWERSEMAVGIAPAEDPIDDDPVVPLAEGCEKNVRHRIQLSVASRSVSFTMSRPGFANLSICNALGQRALTIASGQFREGVHCVPMPGNKLADGVYFIRLQGAGLQRTIRMGTE